MALLDQDSIDAMLAIPDIDGGFDSAFAAMARELGRRRPLLLLAFAPKSAGTYFRTAAIVATGGQLARIVHAEGGRDSMPYLPILIGYFRGGMTAGPLITHAHMNASLANRHIFDAFGIKPVIMVRSIPDMLASFWDMIEQDPATPMGLSFLVPDGFSAMPRAQKADFIVDMMGPWYAHYFATWFRYAAQAPGRVCILTYDDFREDPAETLELALAHAGLPRSYEQCRKALDETWNEREEFRYNRGQPGRGGSYFTTEQLGRIARMISCYREIDPWRETLLETGAPMRMAV
jgi:Sulfotransferase domain